MQTTIGQLMINQALPPDLRSKYKTLDKKGINSLFQEIAEKYPNEYRDIAQRLQDVSKDAMYTSGGYSVGLRHMLPSKSYLAIRQHLDNEVTRITLDLRLDQATKDKQIIALGVKHGPEIEKNVYDESLKENNPLALQIASGTKGKPGNMRSLRAGDMLYEDHRNNTIPILVTRGYSEGLSAPQVWAGTYGGRKGVVDLKTATQKSGYFGKLLGQAMHRLVVTAKDSDKEYNHDEPRGYPVDVNDSENEGALLSHPIGPYARNTVLTPKVLAHLKELGTDTMLVRSPIVGGPEDGGVYANDVGVRERGTISPVGDQVGIGAGGSISEPVSQAQIGCFKEGTLVRMADWSVKKIEDIKVGDMVLGANKQAQTFPVKVNHTFNNGIQECFKTTFKRLKKRVNAELYIETTKNHKTLASVDYSTLDKYCADTKCKKFYTVLNNEYVDIQGKTEPYALLLGLLLGDGCYTKSVNGVHFSCYDPLLIQDLKPVLEKINIKLTLHAGQRGYYGVFQIVQEKAKTNEKGQFLKGYRNPIRRYLEENGMNEKYAYEKSLPKDMHTWNNESIANLLGGLFITDGCICLSKFNSNNTKKPTISFGSTSLELITGVKTLLEYRFGIHPGFTGSNCGRKRRLYQINITNDFDIHKFKKYIPLHGIKKLTAQSLYSEWLARTNNNNYNPHFAERKTQESIGYYNTYDIEVDHPDHLIVLANNLVMGQSKHSGGTVGASMGVSGFKAIDQLVQIPSVFPGGIIHSKTDGKVSSIEDAPGGGKNIYINNKKHYVTVDHTPKVKVGDSVEAGDSLTDGLPNPSEIVQHKGIGEGRKAFIEAFKDTAKQAGFNLNRRNVELAARGLINHVRLHEQTGDYLPDDIIPYHVLEHQYEPRPDHQVLKPSDANNKYLEKPILHYTIGTRITPSIQKNLDKFNVKRVFVHHEPPPFEPEMIRGAENLLHDPDWMTRMLGSNLEKGLLKSVHRGGSSDEHSTSYVPSLARSTDFNRISPIVGYNPSEVIKKQNGEEPSLLTPSTKPNLPTPKKTWW